jgi:PAS domain S-box-containing protein
LVTFFVCERKMFPENDLRQSDPVEHLLEIINSAILLVDQHDRIVLANSKAARMFGMDLGKLKGNSITDLFMPDDRRIFAQNILKITRTEGEFEGEAMLLRGDGTSFIGLLATSSWPHKKGLGAVIIIHNITKLKGIERLLKKSERMAFLGRMLDDMSHQIRNPVLAIGGFARRIANMELPRQDYAEIILDESARLESLLGTLTEFINLPRPRPEPIPIRQILEGIEPRLKRLAEEHGATWVSRCPDHLLKDTAMADLRTFKQAMEAVVINACEAYEDRDGEHLVELEVAPTDREPWACVFTVRDKGSGIRPHILPHVFDPFFATKTGHIGMGLTFAKRILEEQAGDISINSSLDEETSVMLYLTRDRRRNLRVRKI